MKPTSCMCLVLLLGCVILGMTVILFGQKTLMKRLGEEIDNTEETLSNKVLSLIDLKKEVQLSEKSLANIENTLQSDKNTLNGLTAESQRQETERKACETLQSELATALEAVQQEKTNLEEDFNASKTQWSDEITKLQQQLKQPSPVCVYVKENSNSEKLCSATETMAQTPATAMDMTNT